jgi:hypothetical protein
LVENEFVIVKKNVELVDAAQIGCISEGTELARVEILSGREAEIAQNSWLDPEARQGGRTLFVLGILLDASNSAKRSGLQWHPHSREKARQRYPSGERAHMKCGEY